MRTIEHFISGFGATASTRFADVCNPNTGEVQARVGLGGQDELTAARQAQPAWAKVNPQRRAQLEQAAPRRRQWHGFEVVAQEGCASTWG
ncbi:hypothetical protein [Nitrospirillum sp. BR 11163]|uniref:hypothetical protein n=1 Tax=Nitrospirillum sp. BR 11163 TaxID=3104323 RepID=UPI002AFEB6BF|nr:hypothetical protein [Nitrospirillum sp. BR 11163]MEA1672782.1 hypothetical protein [Nitrospirillum sp. BR 11163]